MGLLDVGLEVVGMFCVGGCCVALRRRAGEGELHCLDGEFLFDTLVLPMSLRII